MIYYGKVKRVGRYPYVEISDGFSVQRMYGDSDADLADKIRRYGYRSVTELTSKMCRGIKVHKLDIETIHKLV